MLGDATARQGEYVLAVDFPRGTHAQLAENTAIELEQDVRVRGIDRTIGKQIVEFREHHAKIVGHRLQLV